MGRRSRARSHRLPELDAHLVGRMPNGTRMYRYQVCWRITDTLSRHFDTIEGYQDVLAHSGKSAIDLVLDLYDWDCPVEFWTRGPRGGLYTHFFGWHTIIYRRFLLRDPPKQLPLGLRHE